MARFTEIICILLVAYACARQSVQNMNVAGRVPSEYLITVKSQNLNQVNQAVKQISAADNGIVIKKRSNFGKLSVLVIKAEEDANVYNFQNIPGVQSVEANVRSNVLACVEQDVSAYAGLYNLARTNVREAGGPDVYSYQEGDGTDTTAYVLDTGIFLEHNEFGGRASHGYTVPPYDEEEGDEDFNGHGTHCAGTIMGKTYGAAKSANAIALKVVDRWGFGDVSECIDGLEWVLNDFNARNEAAGGNFKAVVSMSLGYAQSNAMDAVVQELADAGLLSIAAAGNSYTTACAYSPSAAEASISVAASDESDSLAVFTNTGECVDIIAPGVNILSAGISDEDSSATMSGTSMSCPLVAGVVLRHMSQVGERPAPEAIRQWFLETSTKDVIDLNGYDDTPNHFLYAPCNVQ